jgi:hypothetical protein
MGLAWAAWGRMGINLQDPRRHQERVASVWVWVCVCVCVCVVCGLCAHSS